ncbi:MAG TPA: serine/threonine-protein kinase [Polyangiaceae bacterium]|jgi:serine/threonine-protein kinase|nr:serine/threonine-protein kinase [Polyangiaceae bacterium]
MDRADLAEIEAFVGVGSVLSGKYRIERLLGVGGMGAVVEARHEKLGEKAAIKFLLPRQGANQRLAARFLQEARTASKLRSPHAVRVFDIDSRADGTPYIVMEYLQGETLAARLASAARYDIALLVDEVLEACVAIAEAHALGIVHRDLKPANLFLAKGAGGVVGMRVLDFGISKMLEVSAHGSESLTGDSPIGSPPYMSPEQFTEPSAVDHRTDIWSLGVVLYEGLTGALPFSGDTFASVCTSVLHSQPQKVASLRADVPAELASIVEKCLTKDSRQRFQSVQSLASSLSPYASERGRRALNLVDAVSTREERAIEASEPNPKATAATVTALDAGTLSAAAPATRPPADSAVPRRRSLLVATAILGLAVVVTGMWKARFRPNAPISDSTTRASAPTLATEAPAPLPSASSSTPTPALGNSAKSADSGGTAATSQSSVAKRARPRLAPSAESTSSAAALPSAPGARHFDPVFDERR